MRQRVIFPKAGPWPTTAGEREAGVRPWDTVPDGRGQGRQRRRVQAAGPPRCVMPKRFPDPRSVTLHCGMIFVKPGVFFPGK